VRGLSDILRLDLGHFCRRAPACPCGSRAERPGPMQAHAFAGAAPDLPK